MNEKTLVNEIIISMNKLRDYILYNEDGSDLDEGVDADWLLNQIGNAQGMVELMLPETRSAGYTMADSIRNMPDDKLAHFLFQFQDGNLPLKEIEKLLESQAKPKA